MYFGLCIMDTLQVSVCRSADFLEYFVVAQHICQGAVYILCLTHFCDLSGDFVVALQEVVLECLRDTADVTHSCWMSTDLIPVSYTHLTLPTILRV